jgi:hypothetical protein
LGTFWLLQLCCRMKKSKELLKDRFITSCDKCSRKERAASFAGKQKQENEEDDPSADDKSKEEEDEDEDGGSPATNTHEVLIKEEDLLSCNKGTEEFIPTRKNIQYICKQIWSQDLSFLLVEVFPEIPDTHVEVFHEIPDTHVYKRMKTIWKMIFIILANNASVITTLPVAILNLPPFKNHQSRAT